MRFVVRKKGDRPRLGKQPVPDAYSRMIGEPGLDSHWPDTEFQFLEFFDTVRGHRLQCERVICPTLDRHEFGILRIADQPHRLARNAQSCLNLGTDWYPLHIAAKHLR